jgi:hypothetical protein
MTTAADVFAKVRWRVLPLLTLCYFIAFIDRVNAGFAALGMNHDLGFTPWSTAGRRHLLLRLLPARGAEQADPRTDRRPDREPVRLSRALPQSA